MRKSYLKMINNLFKAEFDTILKNIKAGTYHSTELAIDVPENYCKSEYTLLNDEHVSLLAKSLYNYKNTINSISLVGHDITDRGAQTLASIATLRELDLTEITIKPHTVQVLGHSQLEKLILDTCIDLRDVDLYTSQNIVNPLISNTTIKFLSLINCYIPDPAIAQLLKNNNTLQHLILSNGVSDEGLRDIGDNVTLKNLIIPESFVTDKSITYLSGNTSLITLSISKCHIDGRTMHLLIDHPNLKNLYIYNSKIPFEIAQFLSMQNWDEFWISPTCTTPGSRSEWYALNELFRNKKLHLQDPEYLSPSDDTQIVAPPVAGHSHDIDNMESVNIPDF